MPVSSTLEEFKLMKSHWVILIFALQLFGSGVFAQETQFSQILPDIIGRRLDVTALDYDFQVRIDDLEAKNPVASRAYCGRIAFDFEAGKVFQEKDAHETDFPPELELSEVIEEMDAVQREATITLTEKTFVILEDNNTKIQVNATKKFVQPEMILDFRAIGLAFIGDFFAKFPAEKTIGNLIEATPECALAKDQQGVLTFGDEDIFYRVDTNRGFWITASRFRFKNGQLLSETMVDLQQKEDVWLPKKIVVQNNNTRVTIHIHVNGLKVDESLFSDESINLYQKSKLPERNQSKNKK
jgi:hypothetical protein